MVRKATASVWAWLRTHFYLIHLLGIVLERVEALEAAVFHGHPVHPVWVPAGMTVQEAWLAMREGAPEYTGSGGACRCFILTDSEGNIMKVIR